MGRTDERKAPRPSGDGVPEVCIFDPNTPRALTFAEDLKHTIKVLAVVRLILVSLWGLSLWLAPE